MARKYELKRRAERQEETRRRIVDAVVALHEEVGPARTTISAIAERAGVERLTVYRHFPDEQAIFGACNARWSELHRPPNPASWAAVDDPVARLRLGLDHIYAFFRSGEAMLTNLYRDAPLVPAIQPEMATMLPYWDHAHANLVAGWHPSRDANSLVEAAVRHALEFSTWQSLVRRHGLTDDEAVGLMVRLVVCVVSDDRNQHR